MLGILSSSSLHIESKPSLHLAPGCPDGLSSGSLCSSWTVFPVPQTCHAPSYLRAFLLAISPCPLSLPDIPITGLFSLFRPLVKCHLLEKPHPPPPLSLSSPSLCFSTPYSTFYLTHYIYFKTRCLALLSRWKLHVSFVLFPAVSSWPTTALGAYLLNK